MRRVMDNVAAAAGRAPTASVRLLAVERDGSVRGLDRPLPAPLADVVDGTVSFYGIVGFHEPWIGYVATIADDPVGTCAFKASPADGRVEIAYYTLPEHEGRGVATAMASSLVARAHGHDPSLIVAAQTLPGRNASHRILEKLGVAHVATLEHPEDGIVWEWQLPPPGPRAARLAAALMQPMAVLKVILRRGRSA